MSARILELGFGLRDGLNLIGAWIGLLGLRLLLAWEFGESGWEKFTGENWFVHIQGDFPFPFDLLPVGLSWFIATWSELLGALLLALGLATRFTAVSLLVVDLVAWYSVHAGLGYNVCDNGYKLPLIYAVMLLPPLLNGPGRLSLDHWLERQLNRRP